MHQLLGARYAGCPNAAAHGSMMGGQDVMGGYYNGGGPTVIALLVLAITHRPSRRPPTRSPSG